MSNPNESATSLEADLDKVSSTFGVIHLETHDHIQDRRYHSHETAEYRLPNDATEQDRLNLQHSIFVSAIDGRFYVAPLPKEKLRNVLDVGCGTGIWCIDVARDAPKATMEGFDISAIQPESVPSNCPFYVPDCDSDWGAKEKYSLIHTRAMTLGVKDWAAFFRQAYNALEPGGYVEAQEYLVPFHCKDTDAKPGLVRWSQYASDGVAKMGYTLGAASSFESMMNAAGFEDVTAVYKDWPVGVWAKGEKNKRLGRMTAENFKDGIRSSVKMFTGLHGWTEEEFQGFAREAAEEIDGGTFQLWTRVAFVYAKKPVVE